MSVARNLQLPESFHPILMRVIDLNIDGEPSRVECRFRHRQYEPGTWFEPGEAEHVELITARLIEGNTNITNLLSREWVFIIEEKLLNEVRG